MTTPDLSFIIPTKYKPWVALIGSLLTFAVPTATQIAADLGQPWPAVLAAVLALLTWFGVYKVPYAPPGTVLVPKESVKPPLRTVNDVTVVRGGNYNGTSAMSPPVVYKNPWR
ncbi:hypothetical protein NIIDNTM18_42040 [Mycolicibacterium litorale]|uniref:Uncharacterized protein n=1 Tax=Mycolicibacterium litorale TaxID=758802 RepID=A0A6S6PAB3_9MYCO|nr:hypothetical protein [Mycolicibacterium litorale]BCI54926.1 hypothetical protein NIIDNTM18_42040 [Mycolicibacterium litorale]